MGSGFAPYEEAAARGQARMSVLQRLGQIFAGAGQGIAASRTAANPLESAFLGFSGGYGASRAAQQAAEQYAMKQIEAERANELRQSQIALNAAYAKRAEKPEPEPKVPGKQQDYEHLIAPVESGGLGMDPTQARQIVYGMTAQEQNKQKAEQAATSTGGGLDDRTLNGLARAIHEQGLDALRSLGFGNKSAALRQQALARWAALYPDDDLATIGAGFKANQASVTKLQTQSDAVSAFKNTVSANRRILSELKGRIPESGVRFLNAPWRAFASQMGSESMSRYEAALKSIQTEYARIINNPNLTGTLTDTAQREVRSLAKGDLTWRQLMGALDVLERESNNRKLYFQNQIDTIKGRIGGGAGANSSDPLDQFMESR